jgi:two-component system sensor histidine kinase CiaH
MEFVQNASHELRTPLTIIQAKQELLLQEPNAKIIDKSEDISLTLNETKRLSTLVKDLMMLSRADNKKITFNKENVNIDEYIKNVITPYIEIAEIENKKITLDLNFNQDIDVDTNKIYELLIILLDNAIKYTEENDTIVVKTYLKENKFVLEVQDTGIGVSEEGLERIFERFYREDKARSRETGGSGLGLSIADFIVTEHGGTIKAVHNEPKGTIFIIKLPK